MKIHWIAFSFVWLLASCAASPGGGGAYDPEAKETLGRLLERRDTGTVVSPRGLENTLFLPINGIFVPIALFSSTSPQPVFEHTVALEDGRKISVFSTYPNHPAGSCVKVFESSRKDYPRLINFGGCK